MEAPKIVLPGEVSFFFYCAPDRPPYRPVRGDGLLVYKVIHPLSCLIPKSEIPAYYRQAHWKQANLFMNDT